jgi:hypothetical protein
MLCPETHTTTHTDDYLMSNMKGNMNMTVDRDLRYFMMSMIGKDIGFRVWRQIMSNKDYLSDDEKALLLNHSINTGSRYYKTVQQVKVDKEVKSALETSHRHSKYETHYITLTYPVIYHSHTNTHITIITNSVLHDHP